MGIRSGELTSIVGCGLYLATLLALYAIRPAYEVTAYYTYGLFNAIVAGILVVLILVTAVAIHERRFSRQFGTGMSLGLGIAALIFTAGWAITAREDAFLASDWLLPRQRFILVGFTVLIVLGIGVQILRHDALSA